MCVMFLSKKYTVLAGDMPYMVEQTNKVERITKIPRFYQYCLTVMIKVLQMYVANYAS